MFLGHAQESELDYNVSPGRRGRLTLPNPHPSSGVDPKRRSVSTVCHAIIFVRSMEPGVSSPGMLHACVFEILVRMGRVSVRLPLLPASGPS
jgi:hypothetical protein